MWLEDFQLTLCCKHFNKQSLLQRDDVSVRRMKKRRRDEEEAPVGVLKLTQRVKGEIPSDVVFVVIFIYEVRLHIYAF